TTVEVKKYVLPKFKIEVEGLAPYYQPGQTVKAVVRAEYFFGGPVANATVEIEAHDAYLLGGKHNEPPRVMHRDSRQLTARTDGAGQAAVAFDLPRARMGCDNRRLAILVKVRDGAGQEERRTVTRAISDETLKVEVIPENGTLVPGMANRVYLFVSSPD